MASYLIFTPPGGPDGNHERTRFIRDGFSWLAFLFPLFWLLAHRLWLHAIAILVLQGIGSSIAETPGLWPAGAAILFGTSLLAGLEGRALYARSLIAKGWGEEGLVSAASLDEAEEIYFSNIETTSEKPTVPTPPWNPPAPDGQVGRDGPAFGLIGFDGGR
ncbi:DUF2628 domain-containing protein [Rhizobium sp. BK251]|uniref:DUF2628 domain-containing protein n=1 Tax=Rhizobium sp. BK251 TaxID=2512125 RepID=UPI00104F2730|nr:DUF2628 domain-containing protein [Rhizobium sp. BK251]TCL73124.1 uncharacterized protein DUF2628 [Rhizobium sp. BK251]